MSDTTLLFRILQQLDTGINIQGFQIVVQEYVTPNARHSVTISFANKSQARRQQVSDPCRPNLVAACFSRAS